MNTESIFNTFLSLLMVAVVLLSYSMEGVSLSNSIAVESSQQSSLCKNAFQTSLVKNQPSEVNQGDEGTTSSQKTAAVSSSCSTSLQVVPVKKQELEAPAESSLIFAPYASSVSSQVFVFQEPDPPQTI